MPNNTYLDATKILLCVLSLVLTSAMANAKPLRIVTTNTDLAYLVGEIAGEHADVMSLTSGTMDLHSIEARPSYMIEVGRADAVVLVGLGIEAAWLPLIIDGARNPKVRPGTSGYIDASKGTTAIDIAPNADRSGGDIHAAGNPHYLLDPIRVGDVALFLAEQLGRLRPEQANTFTEKARTIQQRLIQRTQEWQAQLAPVRDIPIVTYHSTYNYLIARFGLTQLGVLEPKPGVPPSPAYLIDLQERIAQQEHSIILFENLYGSSLGERVSKKTGAPLVVAPVMVGGAQRTASTELLIDHIIDLLNQALH